jgi:hypothetical protein
VQVCPGVQSGVVTHSTHAAGPTASKASAMTNGDEKTAKRSRGIGILVGGERLRCVEYPNRLPLRPPEAEFFGDLVSLNQAETLAEKNRAFERVAANRRFRAARRLDGPLFEYLTHWYYPVVRELAGRADFDRIRNGSRRK